MMEGDPLSGDRDFSRFSPSYRRHIQARVTAVTPQADPWSVFFKAQRRNIDLFHRILAENAPETFPHERVERAFSKQPDDRFSIGAVQAKLPAGQGGQIDGLAGVELGKESPPLSPIQDQFDVMVTGEKPNEGLIEEEAAPIDQEAGRREEPILFVYDPHADRGKLVFRVIPGRIQSTQRGGREIPSLDDQGIGGKSPPEPFLRGRAVAKPHEEEEFGQFHAREWGGRAG